MDRRYHLTKRATRAQTKEIHLPYLRVTSQPPISLPRLHPQQQPWHGGSIAAAFFLVILLRGPLSEIPWLLKKALKLEISMCLLAGFVMLLDWKPLWSFLDPFGLTRNQTGFHLILVTVCIWLAGVSWIIFSRPKRK